MAIRVECPNCKQTLEAPDEFAGRVAICPACRIRVQIPAAQAAPAPAVQIPVAAPTEIFPPPAPSPSLATKPTTAAPVERIESIVSDVRAELRTLNRRLGCLIILIALTSVVGLVGGYVLFHGMTQFDAPVHQLESLLKEQK